MASLQGTGYVQRNVDLPLHLRHGRIGEEAAKQFLKSLGLQFAAANFRSRRGEIDLIFRDKDCLAFIEVKTRSSEDWTRPAAAVDAHKRKLLSRTALHYVKRLGNRCVFNIRFDIVEVALNNGVAATIRHLPNVFLFQVLTFMDEVLIRPLILVLYCLEPFGWSTITT